MSGCRVRDQLERQSRRHARACDLIAKESETVEPPERSDGRAAEIRGSQVYLGAEKIHKPSKFTLVESSVFGLEM